MAAHEPLVEFDHHSPEYNRDPLGTLADLRATCPVAWTPAHGGFWVVTGGAEVTEVQKQPGIFSSARSDHGGRGTETIIPKGEAEHAPVNIPIEVDPPEHTRFRRVLNEIAAPGAAERMRPMVRRWVDHFLDLVIEAGACDLIYDFASPVPSSVTLEWLGWPVEDWSRVAHMAHGLMGFPPGSPEWYAAVEETKWMHGRLLELVHERRAEPADDVISHMLAHAPDGEPMSDDLALSMIRVLIFGGVDTTTALTGQALLHLHRRPDHRQALVDDPELLESATEEFLRVFPPVTSSARTVRQPTELGGCPMEIGDRVLFMRMAANFDPALFPNPTEVVLDRFPNRHQSFGLGPHRCAGSHIARIIFQESMRQVLARIPDYEIDESRIIPYPDQGAFTGWTLLPATFTPGPRVL